MGKPGASAYQLRPLAARKLHDIAALGREALSGTKAQSRIRRRHVGLIVQHIEQFEEIIPVVIVRQVSEYIIKNLPGQKIHSGRYGQVGGF